MLDWRRCVHALYAEVRSIAAVDGPGAAHRRWVARRDELFGRHPASPIPEPARAGFGGLRYGPYDRDLRFEVAMVDADPADFDVPTATDGVVPFRRVGRVELPAIGSLDVWRLASYAGGAFVPVKDALAGRETYGGGRYLLDTVKGADLGGAGDRLVIDLNFAYNPSCAYDPAWVCPLAPPGNTVPVELPAGELTP